MAAQARRLSEGGPQAEDAAQPSGELTVVLTTEKASPGCCARILVAGRGPDHRSWRIPLYNPMAGRRT
jgi:hypothetical protein